MLNQLTNKDAKFTLPDGRTLNFALYGSLHGKPIMYFHGFPGSRLEASCYHDLAAEQGYRLIAVDRPGMGLSTPAKNRSILSWAKDVTALADHLQLSKFSILGHSAGAPYVLACAYAIPERLNAVAIVSGLAPAQYPETKEGMLKGQKIAMALVQRMPWLTPLMMKITHMMLKNSAKMMPKILAQLPEADKPYFLDPVLGKIIIGAALEAFKQGVAGPAQELQLLINSWGFALNTIQLSVMIWQGEQDTQVPVSHAKLFANLLPKATLHLLPHEGHHSLIKKYIAEILQTLTA